jgi:hypothetical protein
VKSVEIRCWVSTGRNKKTGEPMPCRHVIATVTERTPLRGEWLERDCPEHGSMTAPVALIRFALEEGEPEIPASRPPRPGYRRVLWTVPGRRA